MKKFGHELCGVSVNLILATGRKVNICPDRFRKFIFRWEFISFVFMNGFASGAAIYWLFEPDTDIWRYTIFWFLATFCLMSLYVLSISFASIATRNLEAFIFEPSLVLVASSLGSPVCYFLMLLFDVSIPFPGSAGIWFFLVAVASLEIGSLLFIYFLRDYLIIKYCLPHEVASEVDRKVSIGTTTFHLKDLRFVKAENQYVRVFTQDTSLLLSGQLVDFVRQLPIDAIIQPHRSYLVFRHAIEDVHRPTPNSVTLLVTGGAEIPVSRRKQAFVLNALSAKSQL